MLDLGTVIENTLNFLAYERTSGFSLTSFPSVNNVEATLTITIVLNQPIPISGALSIGFPEVNVDYIGLGPIILKPYVENTNSLSVTGSYFVSP